MSFVKKTLKKAWNFVKDNWKTIALVAAVVFTAGVATIGFSAFAGVTGFSSFMGAVGSTMWAGVAGVAGSMGLGSGATVGAGGMTAAGGTTIAAGTNVGLGAAWGAGGGYGLGVAGKEAAALAATQAESATVYGAAYDAAIAETAGAEAAATTAQKEAARQVARQAAADAAKAPAIDAVTKTGITQAAEGGLSDAAWKAMGVAAPVAGAFLAAAGEPSEYRKTDYFGTGDGVYGEGVNALEAPGSEQIAAASAGPGSDAGQGLMDAQMGRSQESIMRPMAGVQGTGRNPDGTRKQVGFGGGLMDEEFSYG